MQIPSSNPFEFVADAWRAEVDAEAARLLDSGGASSPCEAQRIAERNVQEARRRRAAAILHAREARAAGGELLNKVMHDAGGPLVRTPGLADGSSL